MNASCAVFDDGAGLPVRGFGCVLGVLQLQFDLLPPEIILVQPAGVVPDEGRQKHNRQHHQQRDAQCRIVNPGVLPHDSQPAQQRGNAHGRRKETPRHPASGAVDAERGHGATIGMGRENPSRNHAKPIALGSDIGIFCPTPNKACAINVAKRGEQGQRQCDQGQPLRRCLLCDVSASICDNPKPIKRNSKAVLGAI